MGEALKLIHEYRTDDLTGDACLEYERFTYQQQPEAVKGVPVPIPGIPVPGRNHLPDSFKTQGQEGRLQAAVTSA